MRKHLIIHVCISNKRNLHEQSCSIEIYFAFKLSQKSFFNFLSKTTKTVKIGIYFIVSSFLYVFIVFSTVFNSFFLLPSFHFTFTQMDYKEDLPEMHQSLNCITVVNEDISPKASMSTFSEVISRSYAIDRDLLHYSNGKLFMELAYDAAITRKIGNEMLQKGCNLFPIHYNQLNINVALFWLEISLRLARIQYDKAASLLIEFSTRATVDEKKKLLDVATKLLADSPIFLRAINWEDAGYYLDAMQCSRITTCLITLKNQSSEDIEELIVNGFECINEGYKQRLDDGETDEDFIEEFNMLINTLFTPD